MQRERSTAVAGQPRRRSLLTRSTGMLLAAWPALALPIHAHHRGFAPPPTPWWNPLVATCAVALVAIEVASWHRSPPPTAAQDPGGAPALSQRAQRLWAWAPLLLLGVLGGGYALAAWSGPASLVRFYAAGQEPPASTCFAVDVQARQYTWRFSYLGGQRLASTELHVPADTPASLRLASSDVLHSFEVPQWGLRRDIVPGMTTSVTFRPLRPGRYPLYCAILCGAGSAEMDATLVVEPAETVDAWVAALPPATQSKGATH